MEWIAMWEKEPEVGKIYLTFSKEGRMVVHRYEKLYALDGDWQKSQYSVGKPAEFGEQNKYICGFVPVGGYIGRRAKNVMYYMELPPIPERDSEHIIEEELYLLKQRVTALEEDKRKRK